MGLLDSAISLGTGVLDSILELLVSTCWDSGFGTIQGYAVNLWKILIVIDLTIAGIMSMMNFGAGPNLITTVISKICVYELWYGLIDIWKRVCYEWVLPSMAKLGSAIAGSPSESATELLKTSTFMEGASELATQLCQLVDISANPATWFLCLAVLIACAIIYWASLLLSLNMFIALVEFNILAVLMVIFIPCGVNRFTERFTSSVINGLLGAGAKVAMMCAIAALTKGMTTKLVSVLREAMGSETGLDALLAFGKSLNSATFLGLCTVVVVPVCMWYLSRSAPQMASALLSGGSALSFDGMKSTAGAAIGAAGAVATGAVGAAAGFLGGGASKSFKSRVGAAYLGAKTAGAMNVGGAMEAMVAGWYAESGGNENSGGDGSNTPSPAKKSAASSSKKTPDSPSSNEKGGGASPAEQESPAASPAEQESPAASPAEQASQGSSGSKAGGIATAYRHAMNRRAKHILYGDAGDNTEQSPVSIVMEQMRQDRQADGQTQAQSIAAMQALTQAMGGLTHAINGGNQQEKAKSKDDDLSR